MINEEGTIPYKDISNHRNTVKNKSMCGIDVIFPREENEDGLLQSVRRKRHPDDSACRVFKYG